MAIAVTIDWKSRADSLKPTFVNNMFVDTLAPNTTTIAATQRDAFRKLFLSIPPYSIPSNSNKFPSSCARSPRSISLISPTNLSFSGVTTPCSAPFRTIGPMM